MYSTTSTSAPNFIHADPSSRPITPPPITTILLGTFSKAKAPVEDTITFSSIFIFGNVAIEDPVAIIICLPITWLSEPSEFFIFTVLFDAKLP